MELTEHGVKNGRREVGKFSDEALRAKEKASPNMPNKVPKEIEEQILNFAKKYPIYRPERIEIELKSTDISFGHAAIYNVLKKKGLNTGKAV